MILEKAEHKKKKAGKVTAFTNNVLRLMNIYIKLYSRNLVRSSLYQSLVVCLFDNDCAIHKGNTVSHLW